MSDGRSAPAPRLAVVLDGPPDSGRVCRVEAPDRVLRIWALLNDADNELRQVSLPHMAAARLQRQLEVVIAELERSVSDALADELRHLLPWKQGAPTVDELRVEYASLLGWTAGLVSGMLEQIDAVSRWSVAAGHGPAVGATPPNAAGPVIPRPG